MCDYVLAGVKQTLHALISLETIASKEEKPRHPVDLCLVLDRSGSMSGDRLDCAKKAIIMVMKALSSKDCVHLVQYDHTVDVVFENMDITKLATMEAKVKKIEAGGSTNIGGGLEKAYEILRQRSSVASTKRVFLFSDGMNNAGNHRSTSDFSKLVSSACKDSISTASFGIGDGFNEELMSTIAEVGCSDYFFIQTAKDIERIVAAALQFLLTTLGKEVALTVRGQNGAVVTKVFGHEDASKPIPLGFLSYGTTRTLVVEYTAGVGEKSGTSVDLLKYSLEYTSVADGARVCVAGSMAQRVTESDADAAGVNPEVQTEVEFQRAAEREEAALDMLRQGRVEEAVAEMQSTSNHFGGLLKKNWDALPEAKRGYMVFQQAKMEECTRESMASGGSAAVCKKMHMGLKQKRKNDVGYGLI